MSAPGGQAPPEWAVKAARAVFENDESLLEWSEEHLQETAQIIASHAPQAEGVQVDRETLEKARGAAKRLLLTHGCSLVITYDGEENRCADCYDLRAALSALDRAKEWRG